MSNPPEYHHKTKSVARGRSFAPAAMHVFKKVGDKWVFDKDVPLVLPAEEDNVVEDSSRGRDGSCIEEVDDLQSVSGAEVEATGPEASVSAELNGGAAVADLLQLDEEATSASTAGVTEDVFSLQFGAVQHADTLSRLVEAVGPSAADAEGLAPSQGDHSGGSQLVTRDSGGGNGAGFTGTHMFPASVRWKRGWEALGVEPLLAAVCPISGTGAGS